MALYNTSATAGNEGYLTLRQMFSLATLQARYDPAMAYSYARQPLEEQLANVDRIGSKVTIELEPNLSTNAVTEATGAVTFSNGYFTAKDLTFDQWYAAGINQTGRAKMQQTLDAMKVLNPAMVKALRETANTYFCGLFNSVFTTNTIGVSDSVAPSAEVFNEAIKKLRAQKLDPTGMHAKDCVLVLPSECADILWDDADFRDASITGASKGGAMLDSIQTFRGIPLVFTTGCETNSGKKTGALFHRDSILFGIQDMDYFEEKINGAFARQEAMSWLYGGAAGKEALGVRIDLTL